MRTQNRNWNGHSATSNVEGISPLQRGQTHSTAVAERGGAGDRMGMKSIDQCSGKSGQREEQGGRVSCYFVEV